VVTWQQSVTHTSSIQLCSNNFTLPVQNLLFLANILNLLPHLQDPNLKYRMDYNSDMHTFLYYTDNLNRVHYNFTAVYMWNEVNYIDKCYTNIYIYIYIHICGCSEKFSALTIDGKTINKIFSHLSWYICHKHPYEISSHSIK
jgi:hypothetical protein